MNIDELLSLYADQRDAELSTVRWLRMIVSRFGEYLGRAPNLQDLNDASVNNWTASMLAAGRIARRTVHSYRRGLMILWRFALEEDLVAIPPRRIRRIKLPRIIPSAWAVEDAAKLLPATQRLQGAYRFEIPKSAFWNALFHSIWDSGLRLGDCLRLKEGDFNADGHGCIAQKKTGWPKPFKLSPAAMAAIELIRREESELIFGGIVSRKTIYKTMRKLAAWASLVGGTKKLRKSGATAIECRSPGAASQYLGHKTQQMAYDFYVDPKLAGGNVKSPPPLGNASKLPPPDAA